MVIVTIKDKPMQQKRDLLIIINYFMNLIFFCENIHGVWPRNIF